MRNIAKFCLVACLAGGPSIVYAEPEVPETDVLARRGNGVVTQDEFTARADRIPERSRLATLRDRNRVRDVINTLLLRAQLAADAKQAGFDKEATVVARMKLAADAELAEAWMQHYVEVRGEADYEALAYQYFQLHGKSMQTEELVDVSHILISVKNRSNEEALELAESVYTQAIENPASFDDLIKQYSEDPSALSNHGRFEGVKKDDTAGPFERAAFAMKPGEISRPVSTQFGYHIIRLDNYIAPKQASFDDVRQQLIEREEAMHDQRIKNDYLTSLSSLDVEMTEEALREMARRLFGEEALVPEAEATKSE